jgi:hypothetical protein
MSADLLKQELARLAEADLALLGDARRRALIKALRSAATEMQKRRVGRARQEIEAGVQPEERTLFKRLCAGTRRPKQNAPESEIQVYLDRLQRAADECRRLAEQYRSLLDELRRNPYDTALAALQDLGAGDRRILNLLANVTGLNGQALLLKPQSKARGKRTPPDTDGEWLTELRRARTFGALSRDRIRKKSPRLPRKGRAR